MLDVPPEDMHVLSMGTTDAISSLPAHLANGGIVQWAVPVGSTLLRAQTLGSFHAAEHLVGPERITHIDEPVEAGLFHMDKLDARRIRGLAEARARHVCPRIKPLTAHIPAPFTPSP